MANRLAHSASLYLRQHADQPVDWREWGRDALDEARRTDRPLFVSIGYAACHWCHVMAHESFDDESIARLMNDHFVPVKVDREERPDVDAVFMAATQALSGHGGWPMSVFATPDGRPFMAGTYYPPRDRGGQVGFERVLHAMSDAWQNQRAAVLEQADAVTEAIASETRLLERLSPRDDVLEMSEVRATMRDALIAMRQPGGGFSPAPKFPRPSYVLALLEGDDTCLATARETLWAMARHGLYDHIEGGFARYSVDARWHAPHFEKMLSDQALLVRAYLAGARRLDDPSLAQVAFSTLDFAERAMRVERGFASSLDADAGGHEGLHVTWGPGEAAGALVRAGLSIDVPAALSRWRLDVFDFEGRAIPELGPDEPFETPANLTGALLALRARRAERPQPSRDEKVVLEWNAMMAGAMIDAGGEYATRGLQLLHDLAESHHREGRWWRTDSGSIAATAADVAWLIDAHLDAHAWSGDDGWLDGAEQLAQYLVENYWTGDTPSSSDPERGDGFELQDARVDDLVVRPREVLDGATPSSTAVATRALARLGLVTADDGWNSFARRVTSLASRLITDHPVAVVDLVDAAGYVHEGVEVVVPGDRGDLAEHVRSMFVRRAVTIIGQGRSPLLEDRSPGYAYVCRSGVCRLPVNGRAELSRELTLD